LVNVHENKDLATSTDYRPQITVHRLPSTDYTD